VQNGLGFTPSLIGNVALAVIVTPLFNASRGSILLPAPFHFQLIDPIWPDAQPCDTDFFVLVRGHHRPAEPGDDVHPHRRGDRGHSRPGTAKRDRVTPERGRAFVERRCAGFHGVNAIRIAPSGQAVTDSATRDPIRVFTRGSGAARAYCRSENVS
jgi:hypothetical protein